MLSGHGEVDVAVEGHGRSIAFEISVTTRARHEVGNLAKCLAAGFDYAVLVCASKRKLERVRSLLVDPDDEMIRLMIPDEVAAFLDEIAVSGEPSVAATDDGTGEPERPKQRFLNTTQAAVRMGIKRLTLARWRTEGKGPRYHKVGGRVLYDPDDIDEWLDDQRRSSTSDPGGDDD